MYVLLRLNDLEKRIKNLMITTGHKKKVPAEKSNYSVKHFMRYLSNVQHIRFSRWRSDVLLRIGLQWKKKKRKKKKLRATFISYPSRVNEIFQLTVYPVPLPRFFAVSNWLETSWSIQTKPLSTSWMRKARASMICRPILYTASRSLNYRNLGKKRERKRKQEEKNKKKIGKQRKEKGNI